MSNNYVRGWLLDILLAVGVTAAGLGLSYLLVLAVL